MARPSADLSEYWIHRQQMRETLGRAIDDRADVFVPVLETLKWAYPFRLRSIGAPGDVVVEITVLDQADWVMSASPAGWSFEEPENVVRKRVIARVSMPADAAWRSLTNNLPAWRASEVERSGDHAVVEALSTTRAIVGHPQ